MHRTLGGIIAGAFFVIPSISCFSRSVHIRGYGNVTAVAVWLRASSLWWSPSWLKQYENRGTRYSNLWPTSQSQPRPSSQFIFCT